MDRLFRVKSTRYEASSSQASNTNSEILVNENNLDQSLQDWKIPENSSVYKQKGTFEFKTDYVIKTVEKAIPLTEGFSTYQLLSQELINKHRLQYKFLHLGMVQVGLKPATRLGLNTSALICVRDKRHNRFHDSLLGIIESSLCDGPIYFSCFPNFTLSLGDPTIMHSLCLDIKTEGFNMMKGAENIILIFRIQYKVMNTVIPRMKNLPIDSRGQTTLFVTNLAKSNLQVPKPITWDQVKLPEKWTLEKANEPVKIENRHLEELIEYPDGDISIQFVNKRRIRLNLGDHARHSTSSVPLTDVDKAHIAGTSYTSDGVNQPHYTVEVPPSEKRQSPTPSDMGYTDNIYGINAITRAEQCNNLFDYCPLSDEQKELFYSTDNLIKIRWFYLKHDLKSQKRWFSLYKDYLRQCTYIDFFDYLGRVKKLPNFDSEIFVLKLDKSYREFTATNGTKFKSMHPPEVKLSVNLPGGDFIATPYRKSQNIDAVVEQNNFTNLHLRTIGTQLTRIEEKLCSSTGGNEQPSSSTSTSKSFEDKVLFKPMSSKKVDIKLQPTSDMVDELVKRLNNLGINDQTVAPISKQSDQEENTSDSDQSNSTSIDQLQNMFLSEQNQELVQTETPQLNKLSSYKKKIRYNVPGKPYYHRPTPVDLQLEQRDEYNYVTFSGRSINEWNIDGMAEYQIQTVLHFMTMYATACKSNNNSDPNIAKAITQGFAGQLKGWWDFYMTDEAKSHIFNAVKIETQENGMQTQVTDCVNTLLYTIAKHFIGSTSLQLDKTQEQLMSLRCQNLSQFKWYKDVFLSKVYTREDSQNDFWKEKYISGLPPFFAEKVRDRIRQQNNGIIPYAQYTYGDISAEIVAEGINLCNDIKLHKQMQRDKLMGKKVIGDFCEQIGLEQLRPETSGKSKSKRFSKKGNYYSTRKKKKRFEKKDEKRSSNQKNKKKIPECWKCHKKGHYANKCTTKAKINNLNIDEGLKKTLEHLLLSEEEFEVNAIDNSSDSESDSNSDSSSCDGNCNYYKSLCRINGLNSITKDDKYLCPLTSEDTYILDVIDKISNPVEKRKILQDFLLHYGKKEKEKILKIREPEAYSLKDILKRSKEAKPSAKDDLDINHLRYEINTLKSELNDLRSRIIVLEHKDAPITYSPEHSDEEVEEAETSNTGKLPMAESSTKELPTANELNSLIYINVIDRVITHKWHIKITLVINKEFTLSTIAMVDSGADLNCITEGIIPSRYYSKTTEILNAADGRKLLVNYKLKNAAICNKGICLTMPFIMVKNLSAELILGNPFLHMLYPIQHIDKHGITSIVEGHTLTFDFIAPPRYHEINLLQKKVKRKEKFLLSLSQELGYKKIDEQLQNPNLQDKISTLQKEIETAICADIPNAFWDRKKHMVELPYEPDFKESHISTRARPIAMSPRHLQLCKDEITDLLKKGLIRKSYSPWSCPAFYVENAAELERGVPRLVINYKPLNKALRWIRYPMPNKRDLLNRLYSAKIMSKFDMKSGFWQIQIAEKDRYKTAFTVPFGHYEWNVMPFGLKNAPMEFQNIMNDIFHSLHQYCIIYIDDVLIFSESIDQHFKHLKVFINTAKFAGLVVSAKKIKLFQKEIRFLGHNIKEGTIFPIDRAIQFANKFPNEIKELNQLQRFLGSLNYISDFYKSLAIDAKPLFERLKKNPPPWTNVHTEAVKRIKAKIKEIPCLAIAHPNSFKIVETDASDIGYGGILKQEHHGKTTLVRFTSGIWQGARKNYSTVKKEILSIVLCIQKFESDLLNQKFLLRVDCKSAKDIIEKDVKNIASKQIFARWQGILSVFDFDIEFIKGSQNSLPDFLTREFLQGQHEPANQ